MTREIGRESRVRGDIETRVNEKGTFPLLRSLQSTEPVKQGGNASQGARRL